MSKFTSKKCRKISENRGFWPPKTLPKPSQNAFKIDVAKNMRFFIDFCSKNSMSRECRHRFCIGFSNAKWLSDAFLHITFCMDFRHKKPTKTPSETRSEPVKNDAKNVLFLNIDFSVLGVHFGRSWASKSAALLAAPGVLNQLDQCFLELAF